MEILIKYKNNELKDYNKEKLLYLLVDRPTENHYGDLIWRNNKDQIHRDYNLPAKIWYYGVFVWYTNGKMLRISK